jgi:hypothetical protein
MSSPNLLRLRRVRPALGNRMTQQPPVAPPVQHIIAQWAAGIAAPPFNRHILTTSDDLAQELLRAFKLYSEVNRLGRDTLARHGHRRPHQSHKQLQALIRQAIAFFEAAQRTPHRASPLLYYYAFLNFAKAICFLHDPQFPTVRVTHGLVDPIQATSLRRSVVGVPRDGVFSRFYNLVAHDNVAAGDKFRVSHLLGYITDARWEYGMFKYGRLRSAGALLSYTRDATEQEFRGTLAVQRTGKTDGELRKILSHDFEPVILNPQSIYSVYNFRAEQREGYEYWRTKQSFTSPLGVGAVPATEIAFTVYSSLRARLSLSPFDEECLFYVNCPIDLPAKRPMNELLAIYVVMFFLGSLVRYRPSALESMLTKEDGWMIESVMRGTPLTFLRHARNLIDTEYVAYRQR